MRNMSILANDSGGIGIARADPTPLPGFDEQEDAVASEENPAPLSDILAGHVRHHAAILRKRLANGRSE